MLGNTAAECNTGTKTCMEDKKKVVIKVFELRYFKLTLLNLDIRSQRMALLQINTSKGYKKIRTALTSSLHAGFLKAMHI